MQQALPRASAHAGTGACSRRTPVQAASRRLHARKCSSAGARAPASGRSLQRNVQAAAATGATEQQQESYDVYIYEQQPLGEGEEKHVISIFVADESGLINRVAGVFARRGANIESLAVGLSQDKALFTIVVTGTSHTVSNLVKQLGKLVKVRYVEDITQTKRIDRELMLIKLRAPAGPARTEVLQLAEIFRARVVDVSDRCLTLCLSGDPGRTVAMQKVMSKFGVMEVARTGRISLKRGEALLEQIRAPSEVPQRHVDQFVPATLASRDADVYQVDADSPGVWDAPQNILDGPSQELAEAAAEGITAHTISMVVQDLPGVLQQVTMVFARRGYNVQSLAVGPAETPGDSRIVMVVPGTRPGISTLLKHVRKLVDVKDVTDLSEQPYVARELMLVKVTCSSSQRGELRDLVQIFRTSVIDVSANTMTLEVQGREDKMRALLDLLEPYGILEIARTGRVALTRESGVDTKYLETMRSTRAW